MWDYLHESDAGRIFFLLGEHVEKNALYCIASGNARPLKEYISYLRTCFTSETICEFDEDPGNIKAYGLQADINTLIEDISFTPQVSFDRGIHDMLMYITCNK